MQTKVRRKKRAKSDFPGLRGTAQKQTKCIPHSTILPTKYRNPNPVRRIVGTSGKRLTTSPTNSYLVTELVHVGPRPNPTPSLTGSLTPTLRGARGQQGQSGGPTIYFGVYQVACFPPQKKAGRKVSMDQSHNSGCSVARACLQRGAVSRASLAQRQVYNGWPGSSAREENNRAIQNSRTCDIIALECDNSHADSRFPALYNHGAKARRRSME